jgi:NADH dehydrogenase (ubiquinone) 1 alpha subcomplex subunit 6
MSMIRTKIREEFERHRDVKDLAVIDILLFKGRQEYQETMNAWKQETHIMRYFAKDDAPPKPQGFLEKFLAGRD